ncbi:hypothetical protein E4V42_14000 [Clostridium estertheticum]|uniref:DUF8042 domain-containing protein n=1 Tax=Clostridium estertheticum TaxID=238834 RepID=A0A5N7J3E1_9CLOT|nr:hypothetical protein [Clostridium estertheticum]MPQ32543.1 hypothetical protein [Clostridium estertheticum]MPQ63202.1 hypothetical protein [Clostridium estertheticum]
MSKKTKIDKSRIIFVMSIIFFVISIFTKIHNTSMILKENKRKVILNNSNQKILKKESGKHADEIRYILKISGTLGEALTYIQLNYKNGTKSQVKTVLNDSIDGVNSISSALKTMNEDLANKNVMAETNKLESQLKELMQALIENNFKTEESIINSIISDDYVQWKKDIENEFRYMI